MLTQRRQALQMLLLATIAAALLLGLYFFFVKTAPGQRFDDLAFEGRKATRLAARRPATFLVHLFTVPSVVAGCVATAAYTLRRGNWKTGALALASVALTLLLARLLKGGLIRPELVDLAYASSRNTFPSGHAAAVVAVLLAAVASCEANLRVYLAPAAALLAAGYMAALLGSGWHRQSDVLAGLALAVVVAAVTTAARLLLFEDTCSASGIPEWLNEHLAVPVRLGLLQPVRVVGVTSLGVMALVLLIQNPTSNERHSLLSFILVVVACCILGMSAVFVFAKILGCPRLLNEQETETETPYPKAR